MQLHNGAATLSGVNVVGIAYMFREHHRTTRWPSKRRAPAPEAPFLGIDGRVRLIVTAAGKLSYHAEAVEDSEMATLALLSESADS